MAVLSVAIALLLMLVFDPLIDLGKSPFILFFISVGFSAWYGGLEVGLFATVFSALLATYFFVTPKYSLAVTWQEAVRISLYLGEGVLLSALMALLQTARQRVEKALLKLSHREEQLSLALDAAHMGTWDWDISSGQLNWSKNNELLFGIAPGSFPGTYPAFIERVHPQDRAATQEAVNRALAEKTEYNHEFRVVWLDGSVHWLAAKGQLYNDKSGNAVRMLGVCMDISDRQQTDNGLKFLFEAGNILASSLDYKTTLANVVDLAVPEIADWSVVDIVEEDGSIKRLAVAHVDPAKVELAYELAERYPPDPNNPNDRTMYALRTGKSELVSEIPESLLMASSRDAEHLEIIRQLNLKSYILVPLVANGRSLGAITFVTAESGKHYQAKDLTLAEELARRAALAIDNARLYREAQEAEQRKEESLALLDTLLATAPVGLAFFDTEMRCVRMNEYIARINGVPLEATIGRTMREYLPEFADLVESILQQVMQSGQPILNLEIAGDTKANTSQQHVLANYYPVYSKDRQLLGVGVAISDITRIKQTEQRLREQTEALQQQQQWLENVLNLMPTPLVFVEPGTAKVTFANRAANDLAGGEFPKGKPAQEYHTAYYCSNTEGDRLPLEQMPVMLVAQGNRLDGFETNWHTPTGIRSLLIDADTLPIMYGHPATCVLVFQDITNIKQIEKALQEGNDRLKFLSETASDLLSTQQPIVFIENLFAKLSEQINLDVYFNYLVYENNQLMRLASCQGIPEELVKKIEWLEFGQAICGLVAQERRQIALANVGELTDSRSSLLRTLGINAYSSQPLIAGGELLGTLSFGSRTRASFTPEEIALMQLVCDQIAIAMERYNLITSLQQQTEQLSEANRIKDEFLAVVSHELRTPLNAILGWSHMLQSSNLNPSATTRALETIERNARSQAKLIDDLLDVSRIITGKLRLNIGLVELPLVIESAIDSIRPAANAKSITVESIIEPCLEPVSGDSDRLQQVIWNLLSNAIKFTPQGGKVEVRLGGGEKGIGGLGDEGTWRKERGEWGEKGVNYAQIQIIDTGVGINPDFLPYVFERFRQADASTTRSYGGLGLGLAIVRHLVELHGGTVSVASEGEGKGSTFTIKIPLQQDECRRLNSQNPEINSAFESSSFLPNPSLNNLQVLVVDDEADTRELIAVILEECGARVKTVASAQEAIEAIANFKPDVLLSDIGMPEQNGYDLIRKVRSLSNSQGGEIPAIALTAYARNEDRLRALQAGFQMHLSKPLEPADLINVVADLTRKNQ